MGTADDIDISLWRPFGSRRVKHILLSDSLEQIRQRHIQYAVVGEVNLMENNTTLAEWQKRTGAQLVATAIAANRPQGPLHGMSCGFRIERAASPTITGGAR